MRALPASLLLLAGLCGSGCPSGELEDDPRVRTVLTQASLFPVLSREDAARGVAVVVRTTPDWIVALAVVPAGEENLRLALGDDRLPVRVESAGALSVLTAPRAGHDLRPVSRGDPKIGDGALVVTTGSSRAVVAWSSEVLGVRKDRLVLGRAVSFGDGDPARLPGAFAFTAGGGLLGHVTRVTEAGLLLVRPLPALEPGQPLTKPVLRPDGADMLRADDGFLTYEVELLRRLRPEQVPKIEDDWGGPDLFVTLDIEQRGRTARVGRLELTPSRAPMKTVVRLPDRRPLTARLVERDVDLVGGETEEDLAGPLTIRSLAPRVTLPFQLSAETLIRYPRALQGRLSVRVDLRFNPLDPDRASGADRTLLGATTQRLRRVGVGAVDLKAGDATDHWRFYVEERGPLLLFLSRHRPQAGVVVEGFRLPDMDPLFTIAPKPEDERRLVMQLLTVEPGPILVRVRQRRAAGVARYGLLAHPREQDPRDLVRALFGLVGREASRSRAHFLGSTHFASDLAAVLTRQANLDRSELALSVLEVLGQRTRIPEARHLALNLLELHVQPPLSALEAARRERAGPAGRGRRNARALDAGLLLALRCRNVRTYLPVYLGGEVSEGKLLLEPTEDGLAEPTGLTPVQRAVKRAEAREVLFRVVAAAAKDPDPRIRLRALGTASRITDRDLFVRLREELRRTLGEDSAPMVQRALESAFPRPLRRQPRRPKRRF